MKDEAQQQPGANQGDVGRVTKGGALKKAMDWPGLWVYHRRDGRDGVWAPSFGDLPLPADWEFLPPGDAFVTRKVKSGRHWILKGKLHRKGRYHPLIGYYAPAAVIAEALAAAEATKPRREETRKRSAQTRERAEGKYRDEFREACLRYLDFAPEHGELAMRIAQDSTARACEKHSGRVGRTGKLSLEEKAALAVRARIRHRHTPYEEKVLPGNEESYSAARLQAHEDVDEFLFRHRLKDPQ